MRSKINFITLAVLDGLKAWLEFGIELNLVRDKFPDIKQK